MCVKLWSFDNVSLSFAVLAGAFISQAETKSSESRSPLSVKYFIYLIASITTPALFGESHTSSWTSIFKGTPPNASPSNLMKAFLRSSKFAS